MLLLIDGTPGSDIAAFLTRLQEETMPCTIITYDAWLNNAKITRQIRLKHLSCARPELVEGYLRAHLKILDRFEIIKNSGKSARGNPSTSSGRAQEKYILASLVNDSCCVKRTNDSYYENPEGIILMRVMPEIAHKRMQASMDLDQIKQVYAHKEDFFIHNKNNPEELRNLPVLVLNGNIDFQKDFSHFYNHLFYIRRFIKEIQEKKDLARGIYKEKVHRKCC